MKQTLQFIFLFLLLLLSLTMPSHAQEDSSVPAHLLRFYRDDDYINFYGRGTDRAYSDGTRLEFIDAKKKGTEQSSYRTLYFSW